MLRSHNWVMVGLIGVMLLALTGTASADDDDDDRPGVVSWPAQEITSGGALLRGWVNPNDRATTYRFEYGTTSSYGTQTASASAGSSDDWRLVTAAVSALAPQTTYHYRVVATNSKGTAYGGDLTFTTTQVGAEPRAKRPRRALGPRSGSAAVRRSPAGLYRGRDTGQGHGAGARTRKLGVRAAGGRFRPAVR